MSIMNATGLFIDFLLVTYFFQKICNLHSNFFNKKTLLGLVGIAISFGFDFFLHESLTNRISNIFFFILIVLIASWDKNISIKLKLLWISTFTLFSLISESISLLFLHVLYNNNIEQSSEILYFFGSIMTCILKILITYIFLRIYKKGTIKDGHIPSLVQILMVIIIIISIIILCIELIIIISNKDHLILNYLIILGILYINIILLGTIEHLSNSFKEILDLKSTNQKISIENKNFKNLEEEQKEYRFFKHDLVNKLIALEGLIALNDNNKALTYIQEMTQNVSISSNFFYTPNLTLNYLLNIKGKTALQNNINFEVNCFISEETIIDNSSIAVIVGNLLDNALAACLRLENDQDKYISIHIRESFGKIIFDIKNSFDRREIVLRTANIEKGLGIKSVKKIVKSNNGIYTFETVNNVYSVNIILFTQGENIDEKKSD